MGFRLKLGLLQVVVSMCGGEGGFGGGYFVLGAVGCNLSGLWWLGIVVVSGGVSGNGWQWVSRLVAVVVVMVG